MLDGAAEGVTEAERLLEAIGNELLDKSRPADEPWPITDFSLAAHARSHHRALHAGLGGPAPRAAQIHARPIVETAILMHYLAEEPDVRVWTWVADGVRAQRTMLREWLEAVEAGEAADATPEQLTELIETKSEAFAAAGNEARKAAAARGIELDKVELPSTYDRAQRDPQLFGLYTKAFRQLSASIHVAATLFTEERYGLAMSLLETRWMRRTVLRFERSPPRCWRSSTRMPLALSVATTSSRRRAVCMTRCRTADGRAGRSACSRSARMPSATVGTCGGSSNSSGPPLHHSQGTGSTTPIVLLPSRFA
jgi:Family of unknown function (DUF5677)